MDSFAKETIPVSLEEEMRRSYLDYAMSVIVGRALPDVRDGLKPVHRRVLFAMHELGNDYNKPHKKSARIVGNVMGSYHPHGDSAIYDSLVRMAQDFSLRYPLVDGQGNFGSVDGDMPASMRYTEARFSKIAQEMLIDIDRDTVDFVPNYDNTVQEPVVLPSRIPNLLINGSSGIAVGMATNIPPHNIREIVRACVFVLENPECQTDDLLSIVPAPDFPTAGLICGLEGVRDGYRTGRGRIVMRARTHIETLDKNDRQAIIVDELPYQVNKRNLLERIAILVNEKRLEGIVDIRDESDRVGMRVVIELKRGENPDVVLNNLFKFTQLQDTFGMNMVALVNGQPRTLSLKEILQHYLDHRRQVITRRTIFLLNKARDRGHILEGLAVALANIDEFIAIIKSSPTPPVARSALMAKDWDSALVVEMLSRIDGAGNIKRYRPQGLLSIDIGLQADGRYRLSEIQAQEILQMRLQRLTGLEQDKILQEYRDVLQDIKDLLDILDKPERVTAIIREDLEDVAQQYGDARRSEIISQGFDDISMEDLIAPQDMVVTLSHSGYIKSQPVSEYRGQKRGGRGKVAMSTKDDDWVEQLIIANTHHTLLAFSTLGRVYWLKVYEVPQGSRTSKGKPVNNVWPLEATEKITAILPIREFSEHEYVFMATSKGTVKKTPLSDFSRPIKRGIIAVGLRDNDYLIGVALTNGHKDVMLFSDNGKAVRFDENDVRPMGRSAAGVRGMNLEEDQSLIAMLVAEANVESQTVLTATENGYGKRTLVTEYTRHGRGTKGMIAIQTSERNGKVVGATIVSDEDEVMLVTTGGVLIRIKAKDIRVMGRATQGVTLINVDEGTQLSSLQRIVDNEGEELEPPNPVNDYGHPNA